MKQLFCLVLALALLLTGCSQPAKTPEPPPADESGWAAATLQPKEHLPQVQLVTGGVAYDPAGTTELASPQFTILSGGFALIGNQLLCSRNVEATAGERLTEYSLYDLETGAETDLGSLAGVTACSGDYVILGQRYLYAFFYCIPPGEDFSQGVGRLVCVDAQEKTLREVAAFAGSGLGYLEPAGSDDLLLYDIGEQDVGTTLEQPLLLVNRHTGEQRELFRRTLTQQEPGRSFSDWQVGSEHTLSGTLLMCATYHQGAILAVEAQLSSGQPPAYALNRYDMQGNFLGKIGLEPAAGWLSPHADWHRYISYIKVCGGYLYLKEFGAGAMVGRIEDGRLVPVASGNLQHWHQPFDCAGQTVTYFSDNAQVYQLGYRRPHPAGAAAAGRARVRGHHPAV